MPRNDFISDKLVHMSDRFKENYARNTPGASEEPADAAPVAAASAGAAAVAGRDGERALEFGRTRRDLAGRLARDLAATERELAAACQRSSELERYLARLHDLQTALERLDESSTLRELEKLQLDYFAAHGRVGVWLTGSPAPGVTVSGESAAPEISWRSVWRLTLPVIAAILLAAAMVSVALLIVF